MHGLFKKTTEVGANTAPIQITTFTLLTETLLFVENTWEYYFLQHKSQSVILIPTDILKLTESPGLYCYINGNILSRFWVTQCKIDWQRKS